MSGVRMLKSLFGKKQPTFEQELALKEANMALRVRMDRLVRVDAAESLRAGQGDGQVRPPHF